MKSTRKMGTGTCKTRNIQEDGSINNPFEIWNIVDLEKVGTGINGWGEEKAYILMADLDLSEITYCRSVIGVLVGRFDGNNHTINNLKICACEHEIGLFSSIAIGGCLINLGIVNSHIDGSSFYDVGAIAGINNGRIENCYGTGIVNGYWYIGGICGTNQGQIVGSYSIGKLSTIDRNIGGIAGVNCGGIEKSYSISEISAANRNVGGISGFNRGMIEESYSIGQISGSDRNAGGISGVNSGTIKNSYSTADVSASHYVGGIVGTNANGQIESCCVANSHLQGQNYINKFAGRLDNGTLINNFCTEGVKINGIRVENYSNNGKVN